MMKTGFSMASLKKTETENEQLKSSIPNKIMVSFFLVISLVAVMITWSLQRNLKEQLILAGVEQEIRTGIISSFLLISVGISLTAIAAALIVSYFLSKSISDPIISLRDASLEVAKGNLDRQVEIFSDDETGELGVSFNMMVTDLKKSRNKLEEYSKNLEAMVKKRTSDLHRKMRLLDKKEVMLNQMNKNLSNANKRLKELDKEKDEFISVAAHELKTPLTSIKGFTQVMMDEKIIASKKNRLRYLELINKNTVRLYNLVLDLVDSSRISLGKLKLNIGEFDPEKVCQDIKESMAMIIKDKGIKPAFHIEPGIPLAIGDPERVSQILRNLIINSVHFTDEGGFIKVRIKKEGRYVQFEVEDNGSGIPKENQASIFSRFYQAESGLRRKVGGSGLGLSVCKGLVDLMKGNIWFNSVPGKGTTFYFTIPTAKKSGGRKR